MTKMIERVARALAMESGLDPDVRVTRFMQAYASRNQSIHIVPLERDTWPAWQDFIGAARAAIDAMHEPTEVMVDAGNQTFQPPDYASAEDVWTAMVDAAR